MVHAKSNTLTSLSGYENIKILPLIPCIQFPKSNGCGLNLFVRGGGVIVPTIFQMAISPRKMVLLSLIL